MCINLILNKMKSNQKITRFLYVGFSLFGLYKLLTCNYGEAAMHLGIALAFDPFDQTVTWKESPLWQRIWLIVHLGLCAGAFGFELGANDSLHTGFKDGFNGE
jgi:H+/Cl- antiporter ClcA